MRGRGAVLAINGLVGEGYCPSHQWSGSRLSQMYRCVGYVHQLLYMHSLYLLCRYTVTGADSGYDYRYSPCVPKSCGLTGVPTQANVGVAGGGGDKGSEGGVSWEGVTCK